MRGREITIRSLLVAAVLTQWGCAAAVRPPTTVARSSMATAVDSIFSDTAFAHAHWGVLVRSLQTGETVYERDAAKAFIPASTMKVLTGAVALAALGPEYRFRTTFHAGGPVRSGALQGDLVVRGSGDPTLSDRFSSDPRQAMRAWADSLRARGISRIAGGIVGVDSALPGPPLGPGWAWDDLSAAYAAEVGALQFNEGVVEIQVVPSRTVGEPAVVILDPSNQYVHINNQTLTTPVGTRGEVTVVRDPSGPGIMVSARVPADTTVLTATVAVRDPTPYFLAVLRETLREVGITVEGQALPVNDWPDARNPSAESSLFEWSSPPLSEILPAMMKPSQNWIAETLLRTLGRERRGNGTSAGGVAVVDSVLRAWGAPTESLRMVDGSGLSRYDLITPALLVAVLERMRRDPSWELWYSSLPSAGESGTLAGRMLAPPLRGRVKAKTGTLTGIRSLAGYLETERGESYVFAIVVNNHLRPAAAADRIMEAALARIANWAPDAQ